MEWKSTGTNAFDQKAAEREEKTCKVLELLISYLCAFKFSFSKRG